MAHEPRVFVAPHQTPEHTGHGVLVFNGTSPSLASILDNKDLRELTAAEYTQWDGGYKTFTTIRSHL